MENVTKTENYNKDDIKQSIISQLNEITNENTLIFLDNFIKSYTDFYGK